MIFGTTLLKDQEFGDAFVDVATSKKKADPSHHKHVSKFWRHLHHNKIVQTERWSGQLLYATKGSTDC